MQELHSSEILVLPRVHQTPLATSKRRGTRDGGAARTKIPLRRVLCSDLSRVCGKIISFNNITLGHSADGTLHSANEMLRTILNSDQAPIKTAGRFPGSQAPFGGLRHEPSIRSSALQRRQPPSSALSLSTNNLPPAHYVSYFTQADQARVV